MKRSEIQRVEFKRRTTPQAPGKPIERQTAPKQGGTLNRSPLAIESPRTRDERPQRQAVSALVHERDNGRCQATELVPSIQCGGRLDVHEVWTRARHPGSHLRVAEALLICRRHHEWTDNHPQQAHDVGLLAWSWEPRPYDQDADQ